MEDTIDDGHEESGGAGGVGDVEVPRAVVLRLIKTLLPDVSVHKDARQMLARSGTFFVSYLTSTILDILLTGNHKRKTIHPDDVYAALVDAGFEMFIPRLRAAMDSRASPPSETESS